MQFDLIAVPTSSRRLDCMNCLPFEPELSSDDETDGTHRMLLDDTQLELRRYVAGRAALMLREWVNRSLINCTGKGQPLHQGQHHPMQQVWVPTGWAAALQDRTWVGDPSPTSVSGMLLWPR